MEFRTGYNYDVDGVSFESGLVCPEPSLAQQQFKEDSDINTIVNRFGLTGELPTSVRMPTYADFESVMDYHTAMNKVVQAREAFMAMPADVRARFQNDPGQFVEFFNDEGNRAEAQRLGLVVQAEGSAAASADPAQGLT
jgi:phage internal scaffolding protein